MNWINKLERKFGRYAIPNLTIYIIVCYGVGYVLNMMMPASILYLILDPGRILQGQIWRLFTWILVPTGGNILTVLIMMFFYYSIGTTMEHTMGSFRYNLYIFSGLLFTVLGAFILYFVQGGFTMEGLYFSMYYLCLSIFLAFAACYPNMEVLLYFVLPIKVKWLAWVDVAYLLYTMIRGNLPIRVAIIASLLNFVVFYLSSRNLKPYTPKQMARKAKYKKQVERPKMKYENGANHKCAVCGRTELDDESLEFRFCSKCKGNREYCQDHLFTHEHVK